MKSIACILGLFSLVAAQNAVMQGICQPACYIDGTLVMENTPQTLGNCQGCNPQNSITSWSALNTNLPADDDNPCTISACVSGEPRHLPASAGMACPSGICDGNGACVQCQVQADCGANQLCVNHSCQDQTCIPKTCPAMSAQCGPIPDGCGGTLECGSCNAPETCGGGGTPNQCGAPVCIPKTCSASSIQCGALSDGCGGTLDCGFCNAPETCGGGGSPGVCGP